MKPTKQLRKEIEEYEEHLDKLHKKNPDVFSAEQVALLKIFWEMWDIKGQICGRQETLKLVLEKIEELYKHIKIEHIEDCANCNVHCVIKIYSLIEEIKQELEKELE